MKKILSRMVLVAVAALGVLSSCTKLKPSEIDNSAYPFKAKLELEVKNNGNPMAADVVITVSDKRTSKSYDIVKKVNASGVLALDIPCSTSGISVSVYGRAVIGTNYYSGSVSGDLTSSNAWRRKITLTMTQN